MHTHYTVGMSKNGATLLHGDAIYSPQFCSSKQQLTCVSTNHVVCGMWCELRSSLDIGAHRASCFFLLSVGKNCSRLSRENWSGQKVVQADHFSLPKLVRPRTTFGCQIWAPDHFWLPNLGPGPLLVAKFGPVC